MEVSRADYASTFTIFTKYSQNYFKMDIAGTLSELLNEQDHGEFFKQYVKDVSTFLLAPAYKILYTTSDDDYKFCMNVLTFAQREHTATVETSHGIGYVCKLEGGRKFIVEYENGLIVVSFHTDYLFSMDSKFNK